MDQISFTVMFKNGQIIALLDSKVFAGNARMLIKILMKNIHVTFKTNCSTEILSHKSSSMIQHEWPKMQLIQEVNFNNILRPAVLWKFCAQLFCSCILDLYFFGAKNIGAKAAVKMLVKLTHGFPNSVAQIKFLYYDWAVFLSRRDAS